MVAEVLVLFIPACLNPGKSEHIVCRFSKQAGRPHLEDWRNTIYLHIIFSYLDLCQSKLSLVNIFLFSFFLCVFDCFSLLNESKYAIYSPFRYSLSLLLLLSLFIFVFLCMFLFYQVL